MPGFWQKGRWALFLVAVIAVLLIARSTGLDRAKLTPVEIWLRDLLAPLQSGATAVLSTTEAAGQYTISRSELIKQKAALTTEVAQLREKINRLNEAELENIRLRGLLKMKENLSGQWQTVSARVIARDAGNWYQTVTINRGAADGLKKGLAVINQDGLVGQILATSAQTAEVLLILDKDGAVSVLDQLSRTPGVVEGIDSPRGFLRMIHVPQDAVLRENEIIVSSGLGGLFPPGLRIGYVVSVQAEPNGLMKQAIVRPFVDFERLEEVLVLTRTNEGGAQ